MEQSCWIFAVLYANENILYFNEDSGNVVFPCNEMGISVNLNNIHLENLVIFREKIMHGDLI